MYESVERWVKETDEQYIPPETPDFEEQFLQTFANQNPPAFGEELRKKFFFLPEEIIYLAHGSYGAVSKPVLSLAQAWQKHIELQPVRFFYDELYPQLVKSLRACAKFVGALPDQITFIPNVEFGINAVLKSINFRQNDRIVIFDITYGATKKLISSTICGSTGAVLDIIELPFPLTNPLQIIDKLRNFIESTKDSGPIRFALFEHITSPTAILMPIESLISLCREHGILVMIDGAHAWGQIPLNLQQINPDYYVTNGHKWLCNVRGAGLMYVKDNLRSDVHPVVQSWGNGQGFHSEFIWSGTMDYSSMLSARGAIKFFEWLGFSNIIEYNTKLLSWATDMLVSVWETECLVPITECGFMSVIRIPDSKMLCDAEDSCRFSDLHDQLVKKYNIEVPIFSFKGKRWIRISVHVYNSKIDFLKLASAVVALQSVGL